MPASSIFRSDTILQKASCPAARSEPRGSYYHIPPDNSTFSLFTQIWVDLLRLALMLWKSTAGIKFIIISTIFALASSVSWSQSLKLHPSGFSNRDLLNLGDPATRIKQVASELGAASTEPDTLHVLAIRVEFQESTSSLTTGNGKFDLSMPEASEVRIDPPPHNAQYFRDQLTALANYFRTVSNGKLIIEGDVFPGDLNSSYTVSNEMRHYSPLQDDELLDLRLAQLFEEGLSLADNAGEIDFSRYDSFMLFHAGVGGDFALSFDPTPQDIPSVFLDFQTLQETLGAGDPNYNGIPVNDGRIFIKDGMILPETQSQEGFEIGLLGTMAIMFGHQLGLPNLFDTETGRSGIGMFGLMDQGSGNFFGLLPAEPCAWSKLFLGWESAIEVRNGQNLPISAPRAANSSKIYRIPINSNEYFLVENRFRDFNNDSLTIGRDANGTRVELVWDSRGQRLLFEAPAGVITQVGEYDFGIPGSGVLIWHIDERVISENFAANRVNADPNRRGVDLEEADGAQDLGQVYGFLSPGAGAENGVPEDMFWGTNEINLLVNSAETVAFTPFSKPNSRSNSGANTSIFMTDFSAQDTVMSFSVRNDISKNGFPQFVGTTDIFINSPIAVDLNDDNINEIIMTTHDNTDVLAWNSGGGKVIANSDSAIIDKINSSQTLPLAIFAQPQGMKAFSPAAATIGGQNVVIISTDQVVAAYVAEDVDSDGRADPLFVYEATQTISTAPMVLPESGSVVVGTASGELLIIDSNGMELQSLIVSNGAISGLASLPPNQIAFTGTNGAIGVVTTEGTNETTINTNGTFSSKSPVVVDLDKNGELDVVAVTDDGIVTAMSPEGELLSGFPRATGLRVPSQIAVGDIDDDRFMEIVFLAENRLYALNQIGNTENHFPVELDSRNEDELSFSSPVLVDLNGDDLPEILTGSISGQVFAFHGNGQAVDGFPLSAGAAVHSTPFINDLESNGNLDIVAAADDGFVYVWELNNSFNPGGSPWPGLFGDIRHSNSNLRVLGQSPVAQELMPAQSVYNYPNPTEDNTTTIRYRLNFPAQVKIKIFDLAGELVHELIGPGLAPAENEVIWTLTDIESGIYLARVEAQAENARESKIIKIAVVK